MKVFFKSQKMPKDKNSRQKRLEISDSDSGDEPGSFDKFCTSHVKKSEFDFEKSVKSI